MFSKKDYVSYMFKFLLLQLITVESAILATRAHEYVQLKSPIGSIEPAVNRSVNFGAYILQHCDVMQCLSSWLVEVYCCRKPHPSKQCHM